MKTSVEPLEDNKVKLSVEVDEQEFEKAVDAAFRKIAREVSIPGFRPGKAPRRLLEKRLGGGVARGEALRDAIPEYYAEAVREHDVDVIAAPEIDITEGEEDGPVVFEAVVEVRPIVLVPGYESLRITIAAPAATDEEIDAQVERMLGQYAELSTVERPAEQGDFVTIDIEGSQDGEPLEGLTADDYPYEVGSGGIVEELDEELEGASADDELEFDAAHPDPDEEGLHFQVTVKEVNERVLPEPNDEWAAEASEFETLAELRDDLAERMTKVRRMQAQMAVRDKVGDALADLVDAEIPEARCRASSSSACRTSPCGSRPRASRSSSGSRARPGPAGVHRQPPRDLGPRRQVRSGPAGRRRGRGADRRGRRARGRVRRRSPSASSSTPTPCSASSRRPAR